MDKKLNIFNEADVNLDVNGGPTNIQGLLSSYDCVILKPNKKGSKNVLEQWMVASAHTKYIIKYDFDLEDTIIEMPDNAILEIDCGSLQHGTLVGKSTGLINANNTANALVDVTLDGSWNTQVIPDKPAGDGMGKVYLKQGVPLSEQMTKENTIYVIQYDFELDTNIEVPDNCVLEFDGGSVSDGVIRFNNTILQGVIRFNNVSATGSIQNEYIQPSWFGAIGKVDYDSTNAFKQAVAWCNNKVLYKIGIESGNYLIKDTLEFTQNCSVFSTCSNSSARLHFDPQENNKAMFHIKKDAFQMKGLNLAVVLDNPYKETTTALLFKRTDELNDIDAIVQDCAFRDFYDTISIFGRGLEISRCNFTNSDKNIVINSLNQEGDYGGSTRGFRILNNRFHSTNRNTKSGCIVINTDVSWGYLIEGNFSDGGGAFINAIDLSTTNWRDVSDMVVANNDCERIIHISGTQKICFIKAKKLYRCVIANNKAKEIDDGYVGCTHFLNADVIDHCVISGNIIEKTKADAILVRRCDRSNIVNNIFAGIGLDNAFEYYVIKYGIMNSSVVTNNSHFVDSGTATFIHEDDTISNHAILNTIYQCNNLPSNSEGFFNKTQKDSIIKANSYGNLDWGATRPDGLSSGNRSYMFFDNTLKKPTCWDGSTWKESDSAIAGVRRSGTKAQRPTGSSIYVGFQYMQVDTTYGTFPIYASSISGDTVTWVKADGTNPDL